ncbi:hypothetical protein [uncultured Pedobacter sp.]|uniref:hypothetical protein n=1 Tax=uncultured Pedobacter sp. TaxID=246139 RepID=UPI0025EC9F25|nr:hypothetical protein [uncultured Pedobacter sp.]
MAIKYVFFFSNPHHGRADHMNGFAVGAPSNSKAATTANPAPIPTPKAKTTETKVLKTKREGWFPNRE